MFQIIGGIAFLVAVARFVIRDIADRETSVREVEIEASLLFSSRFFQFV